MWRTTVECLFNFVALSVSFEMETYTVGESDGSSEVCFLTSTGHADTIEVVIQPVMKGVDNPAASNVVECNY